MNPLFSPDLARRALLFAAQAHQVQPWPGNPNLPYIVHPVLVCQEIIAALAVEMVENPDLAVQCALLHDVIEDGEDEEKGKDKVLFYEKVKAEFGSPVADGVQALSKNQHLPEAEQIADSVNRLLALNCREAQMVKLADRIVNLTPPYIPDWDKKKKRLYLDDALLIHDKLQFASPFLAARLAARISAFHFSIA